MAQILLFLPFVSTASDKNVKISINAGNYNSDKVELVILKNSKDTDRIPVEISDGKGTAEIDIDSESRVLVAIYDPSLNIYLPGGGGYVPPKPADFFVTPEDDNINFEFTTEKWPVSEVTGGKLNKEYKPLRDVIYSSLHAESKILKELFSLNPQDSIRANELSSERASLNNRIDSATMAFIAENPSSYIALYYLNGKKNALDVNELENLYNTVKKYNADAEMLAEIAGVIEAKKTIVEGSPAPDFVRTDMDGKTVRLSDFRGKYVLLDFWGTWCGPCRASHPHLVSLYEKYSDRVQFINIASEGNSKEQTVEKWKKAVREDGLVWTQILNDAKPDNDLVKLFNISAFPSKVLIDKDGKIMVIEVGSSERIDAKLKELLD